MLHGRNKGREEGIPGPFTPSLSLASLRPAGSAVAVSLQPRAEQWGARKCLSGCRDSGGGDKRITGDDNDDSACNDDNNNDDNDNNDNSTITIVVVNTLLENHYKLPGLNKEKEKLTRDNLKHDNYVSGDEKSYTKVKVPIEMDRQTDAVHK